MKRKYFFFDIDGTLAVGMPGKQYIPESTIKTLKELQEKGHFVAIATGRSFAMAKDYMKQFKIQNMVHDGGNGITIDKQCIEIIPLNKEDCCTLADECDAKGIPWGISPEDAPYRLAKDDRFYDFTHDTYLETRVQEGVHPSQFPEVKKMYIACYPGEEEKIVSLKKLPHVRFHHEYIFVEPDDKSIGIKRMMEHLQAPIEDVVVFGDERNDLKMFLPKIWTCIAMGNAVSELKEKATFVTKNVDDDGIYYACQHFGWVE